VFETTAIVLFLNLALVFHYVDHELLLAYCRTEDGKMTRN